MTALCQKAMSGCRSSVLRAKDWTLILEHKISPLPSKHISDVLWIPYLPVQLPRLYFIGKTSWLQSHRVGFQVRTKLCLELYRTMAVE